MKKLITALSLVVLSAPALAGEFVNLRTDLGKNLVQFPVSRANFELTLIPHTQSSALPANLSLRPRIKFNQAIGQVLFRTASFKGYAAHAKVVSGTNDSIFGLDRRFVTTIRTQEQLRHAEAVFAGRGNETITVEIFDGRQDSFFYQESWVAGKPVLNAKTCEYSRNNPLWTVRLSNQDGLSVDFAYRLSHVLRANQYMPVVRNQQISGQQNCVRELVRTRASANRVN